jgi:Fe-S-cluster-containing hydrogenase component 2
MINHVSPELCAGCGVCLDACSTGAIQLVDQRAVIDDILCTQCQACAEACPNGAITAILIPAQGAILETLPEAGTQLIPAHQSEKQPALAATVRRLVPLAGTALAFVGQEVAPRLADVLINSLERSLVRPAAVPTTLLSTSSRRRAAQGRGVRRQTRYRRGRTA